jgi:FRG domain
LPDLYGTSLCPKLGENLLLSEVAQALAQHYDFPTFLIDMSLNSSVAAFFAANRLSADGFTIREDAPSHVYRWPARRTSATRLHISLLDEPLYKQWGSVDVVDLQHINSYICRPRNQMAAVANPVFRPHDYLSPESLLPTDTPYFSTPLEDYTLVDLSKLSTCDRFELPPAAGHVLAKLTAATYEAMFPNSIDLGLSYISMAAFLSMIIRDPDGFGIDRSKEPEIEAERHQWLTNLRMARAVLDREHVRLIPGYQMNSRYGDMTLRRCGYMMSDMVNAARQILRNPGPKGNPLRAKVEAAASAQFEMLRGVVGQVYTNMTDLKGVERQYMEGYIMSYGSEEQKALLRPFYTRKNGPRPAEMRVQRSAFDTELYEKELDRRFDIVSRVFRRSEKVPAYAVLDPTRWQHFRDSCPSDEDYELEIKRQAQASDRWLKEPACHPSRHTDASN